jgi:hypothetical protein
MDNTERARLIVKAITLLALTLLIIRPTNAHATVYQETGRIIAIAMSTTDNTAHWIAPIDSVNGSCNGAIYIPYADKEMFAVALTASANKLEVDMYYDNAASSKTIPYGSSFNTTCRLTAISLKYVA